MSKQIQMEPPQTETLKSGEESQGMQQSGSQDDARRSEAQSAQQGKLQGAQQNELQDAQQSAAQEKPQSESVQAATEFCGEAGQEDHFSSGLEPLDLEIKQTKNPAQAASSRRFSWKRILLITALILILLLFIGAGIFYCWKADYYRTHFLPNITINNMDCNGLDCETVIAMIEAKSREYSLSVYDQDDTQIGILTAEEIGLAIDIREDVENLLSLQDPWEWIMAYWTDAVYEITYKVTYDKQMLKKQILQWDAFQRDKMESPKNAHLTDYLTEEKGYRIVEETRGSLINVEQACIVLGAAVQTDQTSVNLEDAGCYIRAGITSENAVLKEKEEVLNKLAGTRISYDWNGEKFVLDGDTIHEWIVEEEGKYIIDEEAVADFVALHAKENDTYGKKRSFVTTLGEKLSLPSGAYGWRTDQDQETAELIQLIQEGAVTEREPVYRNTAANKGRNDIGSSYVEIDLTNQHLYLYIDGKIVLETDFVSGDVSRGNTTPPGVFGLTYKTQNAVLRGATYETPVNYWMPFNGNIGMHDATWRSSFGGDIYLTDGSHGCVNLPLSKAREIYGYMSKGFPVVCYYY